MVVLLLRLVLPFLPLCMTAQAQDVEAVLVCHSVAVEAVRQGVDPFLAVSLAHHESRFELDRVSTAGAVGPLQVIPGYWCPRGRRCDVVEAGVTALAVFLRHADGDRTRGVCYFACGLVCTPRGRRYASSVVALASRLSRP